MAAVVSTLAVAQGGLDALGAHAASLTPAERFAESALFAVVDVGVALLSLAFLMCFARLLKGPTLVDRGLASDTISLQVVGLAILLTIRLRTLIYFDAALVIAILGFASTVAFAQFIGRRRAV
ncbi:MAG: K+/H+ antiporter subunit F [Planctomycetota bacterium]|nr:MAG: K+/H+ antiporter subunit F [Planctomycetota bacterium]